MNQLGGLEEDRLMFEAEGAQIIALAVQSEEEATESADRSKAQFPILADDDHSVAEAYGVFNHFRDRLAAPSVFIISQDGQIVWDDIATSVTKRVPSDTILENLP